MSTLFTNWASSEACSNRVAGNYYSQQEAPLEKKWKEQDGPVAQAFEQEQDHSPSFALLPSKWTVIKVKVLFM